MDGEKSDWKRVLGKKKEGSGAKELVVVNRKIREQDRKKGQGKVVGEEAAVVIRGSEWARKQNNVLQK